MSKQEDDTTPLEDSRENISCGKSSSWAIRYFIKVSSYAVLGLILLISFNSCDCEQAKDPYEFSWQNDGLCIIMPEPSYTVGIAAINEVRIDWNEVDPDELSEDLYKMLKKSNRSGNLDIYVSFTYEETDKYGNVSTKRMPNQYLATIQMSEVSKYVDSRYFEKNYKILDRIIETVKGVEIPESAETPDISDFWEELEELYDSIVSANSQKQNSSN